MSDFNNHDDASLYKYDPDAREEINEALVDAAQHLKEVDLNAYSNLVKLTAQIFDISEKLTEACFNGLIDFIDQNDEQISTDLVYKMKVIFAKALILGQRDDSNATDKTYFLKENDVIENARALKAYLSNDLNCTDSLRLSVTNIGLVAWHYKRYLSNEDDDDYGIDDWSTIIDRWNPNSDGNDFPFLDDAI